MGKPADSMLEISRMAADLAHRLEPAIESAVHMILECLLNGKKLLACGNGGSAADAQHFVAELVGRMKIQRKALPAISLCTDTSVITATSNDLGYENVFSRQIEALGTSGDILVAISTSGRSINILRAFETARKNGMHTVAILGEGYDPVLDGCEVCIAVPSKNTQRIQEIHIMILHSIAELVEERIIANETLR